MVAGLSRGWSGSCASACSTTRDGRRPSLLIRNCRSSLRPCYAAGRWRTRAGGAGAGYRLQSTRTAGPWRPATSSTGSSRRRGRPTSCAWRWGREQTPAAGGASARSVTGVAGDGGGRVPGLPDAVRRRCASAAAGNVSGLRGGRPCPLGHRGTAHTAPATIRRPADPAGLTPERKRAVPPCPRPENGFVRLTSWQTGHCCAMQAPALERRPTTRRHSRSPRCRRRRPVCRPRCRGRRLHRAACPCLAATALSAACSKGASPCWAERPAPALRHSRRGRAATTCSATLSACCSARTLVRSGMSVDNSHGPMESRSELGMELMTATHCIRAKPSVARR